MRLDFGYGSGVERVEVPDEALLGVLTPNDIEAAPSGEAEVRRALQAPIGSERLKDIVKPGQKIAVITSDITRPMPTYAVMPAILDELYAAGAKPGDITLVFALGSHRKHTDAERKTLAGERAYNQIRCVDGDPEDCVRMGVTKMGTPVDITREVASADIRVCLGNIEYHYFAGYSGGGKAIMPGVSTRQAIQHNHRNMISQDARVGKLSGNPVREDIDEAVAICGCDFILNVVLDERKRIARAFAGDVIKAHRAGCEYLDTLYLTPIKSRADIVLVSQGGAPKDINLYQTQKALDNAKHAVKKGGVIILIGSCREGFGESVFESWMTSGATPDEMIERISRDFVLGGHKAAAIAMVQKNADIYLVSEMDAGLVSSMGFTPFSSAQAAYDEAARRLGAGATVTAMPYGGSTLPKVKE